jgi:hypothetical protein
VKRNYQYLLYVVSIVLILATLVVVGVCRNEVEQASAEGVQNYQGRLTIDSGTARTADWNSTAWSQQGYGSVYVQATQDITDATDSVVYTLYYSVDPVACGSVTNWSVGYDRVFVANPAVAASRYLSYTLIDPVVPNQYISYTLYDTTTLPYTTTYYYTANTAQYTETYNYVDVAAVAASVTVVEQAQQFTITGDGTYGIEFNTQGAWCARVAGNLTDGRSVTTTIYVAPTDIYE